MIIGDALHKLLAAGGFVIFDLGDQSEYVQFSKERGSISLFWPNVTEKLASTLAAAAQLAQQLGASTDVADDGLYADFGRDVEKAEQFTTRAFEQIFGKTLFRVNVRQETD